MVPAARGQVAPPCEGVGGPPCARAVRAGAPAGPTVQAGVPGPAQVLAQARARVPDPACDEVTCAEACARPCEVGRPCEAGAPTWACAPLVRGACQGGTAGYPCPGRACCSWRPRQQRRLQLRLLLPPSAAAGRAPPGPSWSAASWPSAWWTCPCPCPCRWWAPAAGTGSPWGCSRTGLAVAAGTAALRCTGR